MRSCQSGARLLLTDGTIEQGRPDTCLGMHARTYNDWIGICVIGAFQTEQGAFTWSNVNTAVHGVYLQGYEQSLEVSAISGTPRGTGGSLRHWVPKMVLLVVKWTYTGEGEYWI